MFSNCIKKNDKTYTVTACMAKNTGGRGADHIGSAIQAKWTADEAVRIFSLSANEADNVSKANITGSTQEVITTSSLNVVFDNDKGQAPDSTTGKGGRPKMLSIENQLLVKGYKLQLDENNQKIYVLWNPKINKGKAFDIEKANVIGAIVTPSIKTEEKENGTYYTARGLTSTAGDRAVIEFESMLKASRIKSIISAELRVGSDAYSYKLETSPKDHAQFIASTGYHDSPVWLAAKILKNLFVSSLYSIKGSMPVIRIPAEDSKDLTKLKQTTKSAISNNKKFVTFGPSPMSDFPIEIKAMMVPENCNSEGAIYDYPSTRINMDPTAPHEVISISQPKESLLIEQFFNLKQKRMHCLARTGTHNNMTFLDIINHAQKGTKRKSGDFFATSGQRSFNILQDMGVLDSEKELTATFKEKYPEMASSVISENGASI